MAFHEVGAFDSIADIVAAAHLIAALEVQSWSVSALPLGSGRVRTQHGPLPVPAPATTLLLEGFSTLDDGIPGERVTPTGAAILRHLCGLEPGRGRPPGTIGRSGIGFGTKSLPGLSNCLRALVLDAAAASPPDRAELAVIAFEIDDQSGEDLAMGLDRLRAEPGVRDVVQMPVLGKKGRMMAHIQALVQLESLEAAIAACFRETTTIGLRHHRVARAMLDREAVTVAPEGRRVRVKVVDRPGGAHRQGRGRRRPGPGGPGGAGAPAGRGRGPRAAGDDEARDHEGGPVMRAQLEAVLAELGPVAVAVSGGVDSLTLATLAHRLAPHAVLVVHAVSPAVPGEATARVRAEAAGRAGTCG